MDELGIDDVLNFGKYSGRLVEDVIEEDPQYIAWCIDTDAAEFDEEVIQLIEGIR